MLPAIFGRLARANDSNALTRGRTPRPTAPNCRALIRGLINDRAGLAFVETAIVAPFLAIVIVGTVDTARYGAAKMKVQQAVNRGLEMSWMGGKDVATTDIQAQAAAQAEVPTSAVTVTRTLECGGTSASWSSDCASGETARYTQIAISTSFTPSFAVGSLARLLGNSNGVVPISASGTLRIQ